MVRPEVGRREDLNPADFKRHLKPVKLSLLES